MNALELIKEYVRFPSVSTDANFQEGISGASNYIAGKFQELGFAVEIEKTQGHPIVLAELGSANKDLPHFLIYGHYDVQPADPLGLWESPPFEPTERNGRIYARGASDNKGQQCIQLEALSKVLKKNPELPLRLTWIVEGEEEIGSPHFGSFLERHRNRFSDASMILLSDTTSPSLDQVAFTTGIRGLVTLEVFFRGPSEDLHSGLHGGCVLNPIRALAELCASLHDADHRVNVPGFYDDVAEPEPWERLEFSKLLKKQEDYLKFLGTDNFCCPAGYTPFEAIAFMPTLEFNGVQGGYQGEGVKTVIPSCASAKISCRLVPNQNPERILKQVANTIGDRAPKGVQVEVKLGSTMANPYVVSPRETEQSAAQSLSKSKIFKLAETAVASAWGRPPLYLRDGGSVPIIGDFKKVLGLDTLMLGLILPEDNIHAPNENIQIDMIQRGVRSYEQLFLLLADGHKH